ncbi:MAG: alpha-2-macroglobulin [Flaviaesturariibacter sp.]|nr:alpha-2-macroglobulin [Flaviaesturariibacter sp.]
MKHLPWVLCLVTFIACLSTAHSQSATASEKASDGLQLHVDTLSYLRQGDHFEFTARVTNRSNKELTGQAQLELVDAATDQSVDGWFQNVFPNQYFTVSAGQSEAVKFPMEVPYQFTSVLRWRLTANAESFQVNEEGLLPVLTNQILITETLPLTMKGAGTKTFTFTNLLNAGHNESLQHKALTIEYSPNHAWFAVQALPYLMEGATESAEQIFNRFYANLLAAKTISTNPHLQQLLQTWRTADTAKASSSLSKHNELKTALLEYSPWVLKARSGEEQKRNLALLFDLPKMATNVTTDLEKLASLQNTNGGFSWFKGGPDDRYFTQYILAGIGRLKRMEAVPAILEGSLQQVISKALSYTDTKLAEDYASLVKNKQDLAKANITYLSSQYLYLRSLFPDVDIAIGTHKAVEYYRNQSCKYWKFQNIYGQGMIALALHRMRDKQTPAMILRLLKATSFGTEESGLYWKDNRFGKSSFWYDAPIEAQAMLLEAFNEISGDNKTVAALSTWLIKNKQAMDWRTPTATMASCYALLFSEASWSATNPVFNIKLGTITISNKPKSINGESGYFLNSIPADKIAPEMGNISVTSMQTVAASNAAPIYGAAYWQYFADENKNKVVPLPVKISKTFFITTTTNGKSIRQPINESTVLHVGDPVIVRLELQADKDISYLHMQDLNPTTLEYTTSVTEYERQGSLGYYRRMANAGSHFYFNMLRKGSYVFEYPLTVKHLGNFYGGVTKIESVFAPELSLSKEGMKITVE